jgi:hypothetical protein
MKRNDLLLASPFLKNSAFSIYEIVHQAVENPKVFDERKHFRKKSIAARLNLGYLPDSNKRMRGSKKNCLV